MRVSSKGEYACLAMLDLTSAYYRKELINLKEMSSAHNIPEPYLVQILLDLQRSGLVASKRGAQGGYYLTVSPEEVTLGDVIRAIEGKLAISKCLEDAAFAKKDAKAGCVFREIWSSVQQAVEDIIDSYTFSYILKRHQKIADQKNAR